MKPVARILVVEDQGIVALDIERQLRRLGYESVGTTSTAEDAVRLAGELRPDLVLMDIHLAGAMDGIEAATRIRDQFSIASVFLTAYATDEVVERAKQAEPLGYIIKPFDEYNLRTSIEIALHKDLTDRKLRKSEASAALQTAALRAAANAIVITARNGAIEWVNPAFCALTGFSEADAIGRNPRDLVRSGEHTDAFYKHMWDTLIEGEIWDGELTNRRKDGTTYVEHQTITPVRDASGAIAHFIAIKRDLTRERQLQAQFLQAQKMEVVGRLAGGIAHDFNNLLTVINGESDLALTGLPADHPMRRVLESILEAGDRAARLTKQLLAFSRKQTPAPCVIGVAAQVRSLAPMLRRLIGEDIKLTLDLQADGLDRLYIDRGQFEQVLLNLAVNARDAMPSGGTLTVGVRPGAAGRVTIAVTDTGMGMSREVRARLFEPFFTTKPQGKGTGLGLATVHAVVTGSGGSLDVQSELGLGATFIIDFPTTPVPEDVPATNQPVPQGTETIVLVEDESDIRELAARMLQSAGYSVIPMESGSAALDWLSDPANHADLLLSDVVLPGLTGSELAGAMAHIRPHLPVLFTSGYADEKLTPEVLADPDRFIAKPFQTAALAAKVRHLLDTQLVGCHGS